MSKEDEEPYIEQYTAESNRRLQEATATLVCLLQEYASSAGAMRGGSREMVDLHKRNDALRAAVAEWTERASDHTGTTPLLLLGCGDEDEGNQPPQEQEAEPQARLSVLSRWDLDIHSLQELIGAGRSAHQRIRPGETDEDAAVAIADPAGALYALLYEAGEPWYEIPGVEVVSGVRLYIEPSGGPQVTGDFDSMDDPRDAVTVPEGLLIFSETW